jgi:hypothetical protein
MTEKFIFLMIHSEGKTFNFKIYVNNLLTLELTLNNFLRRYIVWCKKKIFKVKKSKISKTSDFMVRFGGRGLIQM